MDEMHLSEQITRAVEGHCAHLQTDPFLAQKVLCQARGKENIKVKRKMSVGLVLAVILMLLTVTAVAAAILSGMEVIEQQAVPVAQGNDREVRPVEDYTHEELQSILAVAAENGIFLDDDSSIMRALRRGEGYSEEETIMALCRVAFGGLYYDWTLDERYWFENMMVRIGWSMENNMVLPPEGELTSAQAHELAATLIREAYGAQIPVGDQAFYRDEVWYTPADETDWSVGSWSFTFRPKSLDGDIYRVSFDGKGGHVDTGKEPLLFDDCGVAYLLDRTSGVYGYYTRDLAEIPAEGWYDFGQHVEKYKRPDDSSAELQGYIRSEYLLPGEGDITVRQAREIAFADAGVADYAEVNEVLLGKGNQRIWKITFHGDRVDGVTPVWTYEIDSADGTILLKKDMSRDVLYWARFMLEETYQAVTAGREMLTSSDAQRIAQDVLRKELGDETVPFLDPAFFTCMCDYMESGQRYNIRFDTLTMAYPTCTVWVYADGTAEIRRKGEIGVNGDNLYSRMLEVNKGDSEWPQERWVLLDQELDKYEPVTFEGKLFKLTEYPSDADMKITREQAIDIAYQDITDRTTWCIRSLLIGAEPNPVWKLRMAWDPMDILYEIDAMTGEILDREYYGIQMDNFDHTMKMYTLRRDYMPAALAEFGAARVAMELCVKSDLEKLGEYPDAFTQTDAYITQVEGLTVTFAARDPQYPSYRVTLAEDAMSAQVEELDRSEAQEINVRAREALAAQYGEDPCFWPLEKQAEYYGESYSVPQPGEMTYEEARAHALEILVQEVGQEAVDALGELHIGCHLLRYPNDGEITAWYFYITDDPVEQLNGWCVTFFLRDDVPTGTRQVKHITDSGNG